MAKDTRFCVKTDDAPFVWLYRDLVNQNGAVVGATAIAVYVTLLVFADFATGECYPSLSTLAEKLGCTRNTIRAALDKLIRAKLVVEEKQDGKVSLYRVRRTCSNFEQVTSSNFEQPPVQNLSTNNKQLTVTNNTMLFESLEDKSSETLVFDKVVDSLWKLYPKKKAKAAGIKAIQKAITDRTKNARGSLDLLETTRETGRKMYRALSAQIETWRREQTEMKYIPYCSTWFNQCRFEDEVSDETQTLTETKATVALSALDKVRRQLRGEN